MNLGKRRRRYNRTLMLANILMIVASVSVRALPHYTRLSENASDGLFYGLTIGCYILGIRRMMREDTGSDVRTCA
ncbi:MAG TPA: hypothetical protein VL225_09595 [Vicinamibacterales bacterium]|jgi:hypothetical protein|nr:hypothetical protein [Vicinamibacterales bacterium]